MQVSVQLHATAALSPVKNAPDGTRSRCGWFGNEEHLMPLPLFNLLELKFYI